MISPLYQYIFFFSQIYSGQKMLYFCHEEELEFEIHTGTFRNQIHISLRARINVIYQLTLAEGR